MIAVLYVDDEPGLLELGKLFLERNGRFSVDTITSASEALQTIEENRYDAIISDYQMPVMDGIEFLKRVRASGNTIPFIIFTGKGREEIVIQALNEGADFYIQKGGEPVSQFAELAHKVEKAVLQRSAERSIRDHERRETDIINFLPDATFAIDTNGIVIAWNRAMEKMTGVAAPEILGKGNYEYALPFYRERRRILIDLVLEDHPETEAKYPNITRSGGRLFSEITIPHFNNGRGAALWFTASPLYNTQGRIVGAIESIRDVTERKKAEAALNESEKRFRELADLLPQGVYEADTQGNLTYANRILFTMFGYSPEEIEDHGLNILGPIVPDDRERAKDAMRGILTGEYEQSPHNEYRAQRKDGSIFPISIYTSRIIKDGTITGLRGILVDNTERKTAEETLLQRDIRFRSLIQHASDMLRILDREGKIVYESPSADSILGYPAGENIGRDCLSLIHPDDAERVRADLKEVFDKTNPGTPTEFRVRKADGSYIWVETIATNLLDVPAVNGIVVTTHVIDQRKQMENALRESEERLRLFIRQAPAALAMFDTGMRYLAASRRWMTDYNIGEGTIIGRSHYEVFPEISEDLKAVHRRALAGETVSSDEDRFVRQDGSVQWLSWEVLPWYTTGNTIGGIIIFSEDITQRKLAEEALRKSEERYRNIIEDQTEFISRFLPDGTHVFVNEAYCRYFGLKREEILGRRFRPEIPREDRERVRHFFGSLTPENPIDIIEHRIIMPDGTARWQRWSDRAIFDYAGRLLEYQSVGRDITDKKAVEDELRASEERLNMIMQSVQTGIVIIDADSHSILDANKKALDMIRADCDTVIGHVCHRFICPSEQGNCPITDLRQQIDASERVLVTAEGRQIPVLKTVVPTVIGGRKVLVESFSDITDVKSREDRIRVLGSLLDLIPASVTVHDAQGRFLYANARTFENYGYTEEEFYRINLHDLNVPASEKLIEEHIRELDERGETSFEAVHYRKDRSVLPLLINAKITTWEESPVILSIATDISERKRMEELLRSREQEFTTLADNSPDLIIRFDTEFCLIYGNRAAERATGLVLKDTIGKKPSELPIPATIAKSMEETIRLTFVSGTEQTVQEVFPTPGGTRLYEVRIVPERNDAGTIVSLLAMARDITERKLAEEKLIRAYEEFQSLLDNIQDMVYRTDLNGVFTMVSPSGARLVGLESPDQLIGRPVAERYLNPEDRKAFLEALRKEGSVENYPVTLKSADGSIRHVLVNSHYYYDMKGTVQGVEGVIHDVTELRRAEEALTESEEKYRSLSEASDDLIFVIGRDDRVAYLNNSAANLLGMAVADATGKERGSLFPEDISERQGAAIRKVFETGRRLRSTGQLRFDKKALWFDHSLVPIHDAEGNITHVLGISRDISDLKDVEETLRIRTDELDYHNRILRTLLDLVPIGIFMVETPSGKPIIANREAALLLGRDVLPDATEHNFGEVYEAYIAGTDRPYPAGKMPIIRGMQGESSHVDDVMFVRPDRTHVQLEIFGTPIHDRDGKVIASLVTFLDITERKQAEETIKSLAQFPEENPWPVLRIGRNGLLLYANEPGREWLAAMNVQPGGKLTAEVLSLVADVVRLGGVVRRELKDAAGRYYIVTVTQPQGEPYVNFYISDITERKQDERTILETNRKINLLTSITRHDVANQVTALKGFAQLALMRESDPVIVDFLTKIDTAATTISRHIEFTRTYQELGLHAPGWFRIGEIVAKQQKEGIAISCTCDAEIFADPMLEKVFFNLIDNAARHGEKVTRIDIRCEPADGGLLVTVQDDGIGVPIGEKERIFEKGYGRNTGFGLFLAREILAITGITISEVGMYGRGARFDLYVPAGMYRIKTA